MDAYEAPVDLPATEVFQHVAEPGNLPAAITGGDVGWCDADAAAKTVRWGADGDDEARGEFVVHDDGPDRCRVSVRTRDGGGELAEAVAELSHAASARTDSFRADHQQGWAG